MRLQATWIIPGILITLLLGLLWAMPASAADAGDIMFLDGDDEISYVSLNGPAAVGGFTVQIEDQDLDTPTRYVDDPDDSSARSRLEGTAANTDPIDWENLANMSGDNLININDIKVFDAETGGNDITSTAGVTVDIANGNLAGAGAGEWLEFHINKQDTIGSNALDLITVESSGGGDNMVSLEETGASTGKFTLTVVICDSDSAATINTCTITNNEAVAVQTGTTLSMPVDKAGDTITVQYRDASPRTTRTMRISLDTNNPTFSNIAPAHNTAGTEKEPDLSFDVVDSESGISDGADDNIRIIAALYSADGADTLINGPLSINLEEDLRADEIDDGYSAEARLREGTRTGELDAGSNDEYEIRWWAVAIDIAGNTGVSDSNSKTECIYSGEALTSTGSQLITDLMGPDDSTTTDIESCDPNVVRVDSAAPELVSATTGTFLKADGKTEGFGSRTSIVAVFNEDLDCASVDADDFDVGGDAPNSITCKGEKVYLSVDEMDPNATPTVSVVAGSLSDRAGNAIEQEDDADQEEEADDGIPAGLTVTIEGTGAGDRPVTNGAITVTVSSDERLRSRPTVEIKMVGDDYVLGSDVGGPARPTGNTNEWSFNGDPGSSGLYNVYVTADDRQSTTQSTAGSEGDANGSIEVAMDEDKALLFEVDEAVTTPTFLPEDEGETDNAGVFIRANFGSEGNEYGLMVSPR